MRIGLVDVDGHNYPNLPLMKLSAWHKKQGDTVEWYSPMFSGHMDKVYLSKVFSFTPDYEWNIDADVVERGGSGYCISVGQDGREHFDKSKDKELPYEIEHIYPDYSLYPEHTKNRAFGFMSRGCPRGCDFCHVKDKEGLRSHKVADLNEFWSGQRYIELLDPNVLACFEWKDILQQLIDSSSCVNFNQGLDIRMMTPQKAEMLNRIKIEKIHFAWDRFEDKDVVVPRFLEFRKQSTTSRDLQVYVLVGDKKRCLTEEDKYRVQWLKDNGYLPYVMIYEKELLPKSHELRRFQRYVNNRFIFRSCNSFEDYQKGYKND